MSKALFPGSFDPITEGHKEIILRGAEMFGELVVAIGVNSHKKYMFSLEDRLKMLAVCFADQPSVVITSYHELTVDYARKIGAKYVLRGLRNPQDVTYERPVSFVNKHLAPELEIVFLLSSPSTAHISSSIVREIIRYEGSIEGLVPEPVIEVINQSEKDRNW